MVLRRMTPGFDLHHQAIAGLRRWQVGLGGTSPTSASRAACLREAASAYGVIPPEAWAAPRLALPAVVIRRDRGVGLGETSTPPRVYVLHVVGDGRGFLRLGDGLGLGLRRRQRTRMHHDQAHRLLRDPPITGLHLDRSPDALPMPASGCLVLRPPRFLRHQGPRRLVLPPRFEGLTHRTGARDERHHTAPLLQTSPDGPATRALTLGHDPANPREPSRETLLHGQRRLHTITPVALP